MSGHPNHLQLEHLIHRLTAKGGCSRKKNILLGVSKLSYLSHLTSVNLQIFFHYNDFAIPSVFLPYLYYCVCKHQHGHFATDMHNTEKNEKAIK